MRSRLIYFLKHLTPKQIIVIGIVVYVLVNIFFSVLNVKFDFSKGKAYSLSAATKNIIKNLKDTATITLYTSSDLPVGLVPLKTDATDLLGEYRRFGRKKIRIITKNPSKDAKIAKEATDGGIPEIQVSQIERTKSEQTRLFFGMSLAYRGKKEVIPQVVNLSSLEYDISSALYKMSQDKVTPVGFFAGDIKRGNAEGFLSFQTLASRQFELQRVNLASSEAALNRDITTLLFVDENEKIGEAGLAKLKAFIERGGNSIMMVDGVSVSDTLIATPATHDLFGFLSDFGVVLNKNLVLSEAAEVANFSDGRFTFFTPYPFWLKTAAFDRGRSEFANVGTLLFPWASSLTVSDKAKGTVLVKTQKNSWKQTGIFALIPNKIPNPEKKDLSIFNLITEVAVGKGKLTIIPTSRFIKQQFISDRSENIEFVLNLLNNYASKGALSGIRARSLSVAPLEGVSEQTKQAITYAVIFFLPGLFALFGLYRLSKRQK